MPVDCYVYIIPSTTTKNLYEEVHSKPLQINQNEIVKNVQINPQKGSKN